MGVWVVMDLGPGRVVGLWLKQRRHGATSAQACVSSSARRIWCLQVCRLVCAFVCSYMCVCVVVVAVCHRRWRQRGGADRSVGVSRCARRLSLEQPPDAKAKQSDAQTECSAAAAAAAAVQRCSGGEREEQVEFHSRSTRAASRRHLHRHSASAVQSRRQLAHASAPPDPTAMSSSALDAEMAQRIQMACNCMENVRKHEGTRCRAQ